MHSMASRSYKDLLVWQKAMNLAMEIYKLTSSFPRNEEFGLKSQLRRAAISIPSNIAEGQGRHHPKVFREFLNVAMGSLSELETQLDLAVRLEVLSEEQCEAVREVCTEVGKMLHGLTRSLRERTVVSSQ